MRGSPSARQPPPWQPLPLPCGGSPAAPAGIGSGSDGIIRNVSLEFRRIVIIGSSRLNNWQKCKDFFSASAKKRFFAVALSPIPNFWTPGPPVPKKAGAGLRDSVYIGFSQTDDPLNQLTQISNR